MNFYSSDAYLEALAATWFPGRRYQVGLFAAEGKLFRLVDVEGHGPMITDGPRPGSYHYLDFLEPVDSREGAAGPGGARAVRWLPRVALEAREIQGPSPEEAPHSPNVAVAPYIDWSRFHDWAAFQAHFVSRRGNLARDSRRRQRNLEKALGRLRFEWDDRRPEVFDLAVAWKRSQYVRSNLRDELSILQNVQMFRELWRRGLLVISSLRAGERLVAAHLGVVWQRRFFYWVPAYDRGAFSFAPGRLLLEYMLAGSQARCHAQFDFLLGDERYKYHYATHRRLIGNLGTQPLSESLRKGARAVVKRTLSLHPPLLEKARMLQNRWAAQLGHGAL
jgi:hypothetical protein